MMLASTHGSWRDPALWVALGSLAFAVAAFWWINARRGRLARAPEPRAYALLSTDEQLLVHLPLVFYNKGAAAIVVDNLRLRTPGLRKPAPWAISRTTFYPRRATDHAFPFGFGIAGRSMSERFVEFKVHRPGLVLVAGGTYWIEVDAMTRGRWKVVTAFELHVPASAVDLGRFLPYSNDAEVMDALVGGQP